MNLTSLLNSSDSLLGCSVSTSPERCGRSWFRIYWIHIRCTPGFSSNLQSIHQSLGLQLTSPRCRSVPLGSPSSAVSCVQMPTSSQSCPPSSTNPNAHTSPLFGRHLLHTTMEKNITPNKKSTELT